MAECLDVLGYSVCPECEGYDMKRPATEWPTVANRYGAFEDFPWYLPEIYQPFSIQHAKTAFILTGREINRWYSSLQRWVARNVKLPNRYLEVGLGVTTLPLDEERIKHRFSCHNEQARKFFESRENFLEVSWEKGDEWDSLCNFLDLPKPECKFPHRLRYDPKTGDYVE